MMVLVMMLVSLMTGYIDNNDCGVYDVDSDGDNDNNDIDKDNYGNKKMLIVLVMINEVIMLVVMLKMVLEMMLMIKIILIFKMTMVLKENFCNSVLLASPQLMIRIYHFLIQLDVNNLCSIKMY